MRLKGKENPVRHESGKPCKLLVTGASRSGKSKFALTWAQAYDAPRLFLATAKAMDQEMAERIKKHKEDRGPGWITVEEPLRVEDALSNPPWDVGAIVLDCVTLWLSNLILEGLEEEDIKERGQGLCRALVGCPKPAALVTNEVGWGIVPESPLGRRFRDLSGLINQMLASAADQVILMVAGLPVIVKSSCGVSLSKEGKP